MQSVPYGKHYKNIQKTDRKKTISINYEAKKVVEKLSIDDRVEKMQENVVVFITIKDHKERFLHRVSCRLLHPSKTNIEKISKVLLDKINLAVPFGTKINQSKNTSSVITWFEKVTHKQTSSFICFDVENFYPFFSCNLFKEFARQFIHISDDDLSIVMQARKTLVFEGTPSCIKKSGDEDLDLLMGCFDGCEI